MSKKISLKNPGNDFENGWVYSRWRNVDNDSADVTSEGRSFHVRATTTGNARLATVDSLHDGRHYHPTQVNALRLTPAR